MNELALFAGAGGGILGGQLLGWKTVCAVECNAYAASVLCARQNDGLLPPFPIWDDVRTFDGKPWRGIVDVVSGGFPCQDISAAGKGKGITGERSGLWKEFARIICEVRPRFAFVENSPVLTSRGLDTVLGDLAALGYDAEWGVLGAEAVGAPHQRDRIWIVAYSMQPRCKEQHAAAVPAKQGKFTRRDNQDHVADTLQQWRDGRLQGFSWWEREPLEALQDARRRGRKKNGLSIPESLLGRVANGVAARVDRLTAIGNGQVPACAAKAFTMLSKRFLS